MTLRNGFNLKIKQSIKNNLLSINKHLHRNYINMGMIEEDNLFLEAEEADEDSLTMIMEAEEDTNAPKADAKPAEAPKEKAAPKEEAPADDKGGDTTDANTDGDEGGLFGEAEAEANGEDTGDDQELAEGLPTDDQYYVVILKDVNKKITKLNEISLKLLKKTNETESKIINKIDSLTYIFNRFVEKYTEYEDAKNTVIHLREMTDAIIEYTDRYLLSKEGKEYRQHMSKLITAGTRLKFIDNYMFKRAHKYLKGGY